MKSFQSVLHDSKKELLDRKREKINDEKKSLLENLKRKYLITDKLKNLPADKQKNMLNMLLEFWNPKSGINVKGIKFLKEDKIAISKKSTPENIKQFAIQEIQNNIDTFKNAFVMNQGKQIVEQLQQNIEIKSGKKINFNNLFESTLNMVNKKIKVDNITKN